MKKEQVSLKEIKKDIMKSILRDIYQSFGWLFYLTIVAAFIEWFFLPDIPLIEISTIPFLIRAVLCVIDICSIRGKKLIITVITDVLADKKDRIYRWWDGQPRLARPAWLFFNYEWHYDIYYYQKFYRWSAVNSMNERDLFNTSCVEDTFTVVKIRNKIRTVYNHRFFDVQYPKT